jgi:glutamyl-tRNA synthetase
VDSIRVRFAPSPTGTLHIGGARTALFNWLFARHYNGRLVLRLEDTDLVRSDWRTAAGILEGLRWLGLDWDEGPDKDGDYGPYRQSDRLEIYQGYLRQLLESGQAYYCFCSSAELKEQRDKARLEKRNYTYDGCCRNLTPEAIANNFSLGIKPAVRLKVAQEGKTVVNDLIRGQVEFDNQLLDDFIIGKSDGWPTYNFAVVIDDHCMNISHVIRAEEHLSNTPKQLAVYKALGLKPPQFAHVSMILAPDRSKLSKRHGATSVQEFRDDGILPEALVNYLALLGWSPGEESDLIPRAKMIQLFSLDKISRSAAIYDLKKLIWMNNYYITSLPLERILELVAPLAAEYGWLDSNSRDHFRRVIELVRSRAQKVSEILQLAEYFYCEPSSYDSKGVEKYFCKEGIEDILGAVIDLIKHTSVFQAEGLERSFRQKAELMGLKAGHLIHPTRLALSGRTNTPGLFEIMEILGAPKVEHRIMSALVYVNSLKNGGLQ